MEHAVYEPSELPLRRVDELRPRHVPRRVVEHDSDLDDDLEPGRDDGEVAEGEHAADVGKRMWNRDGGTVPKGLLAHNGQIRARCVEIVRDRDVVQVVRRPARVDNGARKRVEHNRDSQLVGEGDTDGGRSLETAGRAHRIPFIDFLDRYKEVLAVRPDPARRAVREPEEVPPRIQVAG